MSLAEQIVFDVLTGGKPIVRLMQPGDDIPKEFQIGFDLLGQLDYHWIWVVERYGKIEGCVVAAPCHGVAYMYRVAISPQAPKSTLLKLARYVTSELRSRGIKGMMMMIDPNVEMQVRLKGLFEKWGGGTNIPAHELIGCPVPEVF